MPTVNCNIRNVVGAHDTDVCKANACLESLYDRITKQTSTATFPAYYLRTDGGSSGSTTNQFLKADIAASTAPIVAKNVILAEKTDTTAIATKPTTTTTTIPITPDPNDSSKTTTTTTLPTAPTNFDTASAFKGFYGLIDVNNLLKTKISTILDTNIQANTNTPSISDENEKRLEIINSFYEKKDTKDTLEEIAYRETQIYREKFVYIILLVIGIFIIGTQLRQRWFSDMFSGSGTGLFGAGGLFGLGGLFSGSGSSFGSSRIGQWFSSFRNPYSLQTR